ncbi:RHS repeat-associated core domain-containing protein [Rapidithrix thailandica]|uniref:RHS repeat-associated core domain-containing protein n=1 Tax=Rapidithrix thailandica TaxID=413964 RepID=A0AAW9SJJ2_9BACT
MLLANTHLTPIIGIDIHFTTLPPFNPFHPFIGIVMDPMDYVPFIGTNVHVNGLKSGVSTTSGMLVTYMHIPLFTPPWALAPIIGHESVNFFGSDRVFSEGTRLSPRGHMLMTCNDIGIPLSLSPGKKKFWKVVPTLFAPTSFSLPIPTGPPVMVGGPYVPDWGSLLTDMIMGFGLGAVMRKAGKQLTKLNHLLKKRNAPKKLTRSLCWLGFEPINLITGAVVYEGNDFELPGPIPLSWDRAWYSDTEYEGWLGHGVHHALDRCIELYPEDGELGLRMEDGRLVGFPLLDYGEEFYSRQEKLTLKRLGNGRFQMIDHNSALTYHFEGFNGSDRYRLTRIETPAGKALCLHLNGDRLTGITDSAGRELEVDSDAKGRITEIRLNESTLVGYRYDAEGNMAGILDSLGQETVMEYQEHLMVKKTDRNGQAFYWEYDNESRCVHTWGGGGYQEGWFEYHTEEGFNLIIDANGATTTYHYTPEGLVTQVKDPLNNSRFLQYTEFMELYREIDEAGNLTGYTYDERGNRTGIVYPDGTEEGFVYDEEDRLILASDAEGQCRTYSYVDGKPHLLGSVVEPDNSYTMFEYDEEDLLVEVRQNGQKSLLAYDEQQNLVRFTDAMGHSTRWVYDDWGRVRAVQAEGQSQQQFNYDALGRVVGIQGADQNQTQLRYNAYDEVIEALDKHHHVRFEYTPMGSLKMREENGKKVFFDYDKMEQLLRIENERQERYRFTRNLKGDIIEEEGFDGLTRKYDRDSAGKVLKVQRPGKRFSEYEYDALGRISRVDHQDGSWETYGYNKNGQLVEARTEKNAILIERDALGRVIREVQTSGLPGEEGYEVLSTYNRDGQRTQITSSLGADIQNNYDALGRRTGTTARVQTEEEGEAKTWEAKLQHNALGQEIERELTGGITSTFTYDEAGRPTSQRVKRGFHDNRHYRYNWDANHRLKETLNALTQGKIQYAYDAFGNLASAKYQDGSYDYKLPDEVGNLYKDPKKQEVYGKGGKLLKDENWYYQYDEEGNLIRKTKEEVSLESQDPASQKEAPQPKFSLFLDEKDWGSREEKKKRYTKAEKEAYRNRKNPPALTPRWKHGDWYYTWQANGMLQSVKRPDGTEISFEYDALGRRTAKLNHATEEITRFVWDGNVPLHEWRYALKDRPQTVANDLGELSPDKPEPEENLITWVFDEGSFVPSAKIVEGEPYSIVSDYLGTPCLMYNSIGNLVWQAELDIYGKIRTLAKGSIQDCPFRYQGQYEDAETGLYYNRFRYYSPESGTYISQDPIGLAGNNPNIYAYTKDSNIWIDIFGLDCNSLGEWGEKFAKEQLEGSGKYKRVFPVQNKSNNGIDLVGQRHDGKFDFFEVKTTGVGKDAKGNRQAVGLSKRQQNSNYFIRDILGKNDIDKFGLTRSEAQHMLNNIGDKRVIDVFVDNGKVNSVLTSIW